MATPLTVAPITRDQHLSAIAHAGSASFLQTPAWGEVKGGWRAESVGWFEGEPNASQPVGSALILYRQAPGMRRYLAYIPEGPAIDWADAAAPGGLARWIDPLLAHVKRQAAFGLRIGPMVVTRRWSNATLKAALADSSVTRLRDVPADETTDIGRSLRDQFTAAGWRPPRDQEGFAAGQPRHVFQLPVAGCDRDAVFKGFNQLWRRNIKKADKAGVTVRLGTADDLPTFHALYEQTARRDGFTPRPLSYFQTMWNAMTAEAPDRLRLYMAEHDGDLVASTTMTQVGRHAWYSYGASSTEKREVRGSNAIQWRMITDALDDGAEIYDLRGITDTLDESDPHAGLIRFKLGTGGEAVEYLGEWDLPISRILYTGFDLYVRRRG